MTSSEVTLLALATANIIAGILLYSNIFNIKCKMPICVSWMGRGLTSLIIGCVFIYILVAKKVMMSTMIFNYLYELLLAMYALWQIKFTINSSKSNQKKYMLVMNSLVCLTCLKYLVIFSRDCLGVSPQFMKDNQMIFIWYSIIIEFLFMVFYTIYTIRNTKRKSKPKLRWLIHLLQMTLGVMIFYNNLTQVLFDTILISTLDNGFMNNGYVHFFYINTIIKLFLNIIYMGMVWVQVVCFKGRYLED